MDTYQETKKKLSSLFWVIYILPILIVALLFYLISIGKLGYMPDWEELENPKMGLAAQLITEDNELLAKYSLAETNRTNVTYEDLSPYLVNALVATEDIRFYKHSGIDLRGLARAVFFMGSRGGASTITQQLAKQLYHTRSSNFFKTLWQKLNEWVIAVKLEKSYTKEEIIALYLNQFDFLHLAIGIESASKVYFNSTPDSLKIEEAATLIGMAQNPALFNPLRRPDTTLHRRNIVLSQMNKYGYLADSLYDSIKTLPLDIDYQRVDHNTGLATHYREYLRKILTASEPQRKSYNNYKSYQDDSADWANDALFGWCNKNLKPDGTPYNLYKDGLRIYTTINYKMQEYAEEAVKEHLSKDLQKAFDKEKKGMRNAPFSRDLTKEQREEIMTRAMTMSERYRLMRRAGISVDSIRQNFDAPTEMTVFSWDGDKDTIMTPWDSIRYYKHFLRAGVMSANPHTGHVKTYVGGLDMKYFQYDHVKLAHRQAGSLFKPFLYTLAWQNGYSPCYQVEVVPQTFPDKDSVWIPRTTGTKYIGTVQTLKWGLAQSENLVSAWLLKQFSIQPIVDMAHKVGIESYIDPVYSMIYGVSDMTVYEMVSAFGTFANKGIHVKPIFVSRIEDKNGNLLATFKPQISEAISENTAYLMLNAMEEVVNRGTAVWLRTKYQFTSEIAGKTGTTQESSDGWFMGIIPDLVTGVWVGGEDRSINFENSYIGQGAHMALPIWALYMKKVYGDEDLSYSIEDVFEVPENLNVDINCSPGSNQTYDTPEDYGLSEGIGY